MERLKWGAVCGMLWRKPGKRIPYLFSVPLKFYNSIVVSWFLICLLTQLIFLGRNTEKRRIILLAIYTACFSERSADLTGIETITLDRRACPKTIVIWKKLGNTFFSHFDLVYLLNNRTNLLSQVAERCTCELNIYNDRVAVFCLVHETQYMWLWEVCALKSDLAMRLYARPGGLVNDWKFATRVCMVWRADRIEKGQTRQ